MANKEGFEANKKLFQYLYFQEKPQKADVAIGFGHFDMKIPARCAELYEKELVNKIIFTGGIGAGTADLGKAEADAFLDYIKVYHPKVDLQDILIENQSTNTGENIRFTLSILRDFDLGWYNATIKGKLLLVANPFRQRRVFLTASKLLPEASLVNCPPLSSYEEEVSLFATKEQNLAQQLPGEVRRIIDYPTKGWITQESVPPEIITLIS